MHVEGSCVQETAVHSTSAPLALIGTALCCTKSRTDTNLCVCVCMRAWIRVRASVCLFGSPCVAEGLSLCLSVCVRARGSVHGSECYDINLLGTGSALCWHVSPSHADNVKYLSTGVCCCPDNQRKTALLLHKYAFKFPKLLLCRNIGIYLMYLILLPLDIFDTICSCQTSAGGRSSTGVVIL